MSDTPQSATSVRSWMKLVLVASLALNLAVLGLLAGLALRGPIGEKRPQFAPGDGLIRMHQALPNGPRRELGREFFRRRGEMRELRDEMERLRRDLPELLVAEPFDMEAVEANLLAQRERLATVGSDALVLMTETIGSLSAEERRAFADNLRREGGRPPRGPRDARPD